MNQVKVEIDIGLIEELFINCYKTREYEVASTMILELKESVEIYLGNKLVRGYPVSLMQAFSYCVDELVLCEDEFEEMNLAC